MLSAGPHLLHIKNGRIISQTELPARILRLQATKPVQPAAFLAITTSDAVLVAPGKRDDLDTIQLLSSTGGNTPKGCLLNDGRIAVGDESSTLIYSAYPATTLISSVPLGHPDKARQLRPASYTAWGTRHLAVLNWDGVIDWYG